eukprot:TRINITY_DN6303_c0_g1_i3.p1 TRINITY_DN6303_c0_g1~~TRINITY_DN6303_c0_g1_i3.p1  ORF type:complete len:363 (+),score=61.82 TRINITY_DN6303_c0_g1_i3:89-1177(+)
MWVVEEMISHRIDFSACPIGIVPFGTGNDLSHVLGWGIAAPKTLLGENLVELKRLIVDWIDATISDFDIWDIDVEVNENRGAIVKVRSDEGRVLKRALSRFQGPTEVPILHYHRKMSNYLSIGIDARIGFGFDKKRTRSTICNKCVYGWEGFKKLFTRTVPINEAVHSVEVGFIGDPPLPPEGQIKLEKNESKFQVEVNQENQKLVSLFSTAAQRGAGENALQGSPVCLIGLNINSYGSGTDPWGTSRGKVAVLGPDGRPKEDVWGSQSFNDGKLEFVCYNNPVRLAMERMIKGQASRLGQGGGPFAVKFRDLDINGPPMRTYLNIDGEFFQLIAPKSITISLAKEIPGGKIKVLRKKPASR